MFIAVSIYNSQDGNISKCSLTKQWIKKMCYTYIYMYIHPHNGVLVIKRMK